MTRTKIPVLPLKVRQARRDKLKALGIPAHVPAAQPRQHVNELLGFGMKYAMIAESAGVSSTLIRSIHLGTYETLRFDRAAAVMRATHTPDPDATWALAIGAQRRILTLGLMGWSHGYIGERLGVTRWAIMEIFTWVNSRTGTSRTRTVIRAQRWKQIADLYDELCMKPGPSKAAATMARNKGAYFPLEWEGLDIDDPRVTPKRARYRRESTDKDRSERDTKTAQRRSRVAELTADGLSAHQIAVRLGISQRTVVRDRQYLDAPRREAS